MDLKIKPHADCGSGLAVRILGLGKEGLGARKIAEAVLGDAKLHLRVYRFLNR